MSSLVLSPLSSSPTSPSFPSVLPSPLDHTRDDTVAEVSAAIAALSSDAAPSSHSHPTTLTSSHLVERVQERRLQENSQQRGEEEGEEEDGEEEKKGGEEAQRPPPSSFPSSSFSSPFHSPAPSPTSAVSVTSDYAPSHVIDIPPLSQGEGYPSPPVVSLPSSAVVA